MNKEAKIFIAGHRGMVGSAILRKFIGSGFENISTRTHAELDLISQQSVEHFFQKEKPEYVILAAAKVGGIVANNEQPAEFIYQNLMIQNNVIHQAYKAGVKQLMFLGSSCIYPKHANQPINESELLQGELEPTNEAYALAKIAGIKLCESYNRQYATDFRSLMPTNLYGPNDNYDLRNSHVIPALIRKIHEAKEESRKTVDVWGTGKVRREFLYVEDLADACFTIMNLSPETFWSKSLNTCSHLNIGTEKDISIKELVDLLQQIMGYKGKAVWDNTKPDGTPRKLLDTTKARKLGWLAKTGLEDGLIKTYRAYLLERPML